MRRIWAHRELLNNFTRKELKVRYKGTAFGFLWTLFTPALYLVVFFLVFQVFLGSGIPLFAIYLLCGLLPWNLFASSVNAGAVSITGNAGLVQKVWFPREALPLAAVGSSLVHFGLQLSVLAGALAVFSHAPDFAYLPLLIPTTLVLVVLCAAMAMMLSVVNVYMRDTQHLLELILLAGFWMTPIVYPFRFISDRSEILGQLLLLNPLTTIVLSFQRAIYGIVDQRDAAGNIIVAVLPDTDVDWYLRNLAVVGFASLVLLVVSMRLFARLEKNVAEEL